LTEQKMYVYAPLLLLYICL